MPTESDPIPPLIVCTMSVKGGTGKSLTAINIASKLASKYKVAVFDADVDSPNLPSMLGISEPLGQDKDKVFQPVWWQKNGVSLRVVSIGLFDTSGLVTLFKRGEEARQILNDLMKHTNWADTEVIVIDLPAGSGDELRAILEMSGDSMLGVILVSLPVTLDDCVRVVELCSRNHLPILGMIQNMVGAVSWEGKRVVIEGTDEDFYPLGLKYKQTQDGHQLLDMEGIAQSFAIPYFGGVPLVGGMYERILDGDPIIPQHSAQAIEDAANFVSGMIDQRRGVPVEEPEPKPKKKKKRGKKK